MVGGKAAERRSGVVSGVKDGGVFFLGVESHPVGVAPVVDGVLKSRDVVTH